MSFALLRMLGRGRRPSGPESPRDSPHEPACCKAAFFVRRRCKANTDLAAFQYSVVQCLPCRPEKTAFRGWYFHEGCP